MQERKPMNWSEVIRRIGRTRNFRALIKWSNMYDNFTLFPNMSSEQKTDWEQWLFQKPKMGTLEEFQETYCRFGAFGFLINDGCELRYKPHRGRQQTFTETTPVVVGEYLGFHPRPLGSLEAQTLAIRDAVILVSDKLVELKVPFQCPKPFSIYSP